MRETFAQTVRKTEAAERLFSEMSVTLGEHQAERVFERASKVGLDFFRREAGKGVSVHGRLPLVYRAVEFSLKVANALYGRLKPGNQVIVMPWGRRVAVDASICGK